MNDNQLQKVIGALQDSQGQAERAAQADPARADFHKGEAKAYAEALALLALAGGKAATPEPQADLLSVPEAAKLTGLAEVTLRRYIATRKLPAVRYGPRLVRVRRADLEKLAKGYTPPTKK